MNQLPIQAQRLGVTFYDRPTSKVARELIGKALFHRVGRQWLGGWVVETEAYLDTGDAASHSARGRTNSNASMFGSPGTLYVYPIHAKHCLNAVTQSPGEGAAVLIRAIEPIWGIETMQRLRGYDDLRRLTRGPAMLCQALGVDRDDDGRSLICDDGIGVFSSPVAPQRIVQPAKRIGINKAQHRKLRFVDPNSTYISRQP